jgi:nucleoside-diphosphate-sugar epimerase
VIVVVGATSYLGARVIRFLVDSGHEIVPISRDPDLSTIVLGSDLPRAVRLDDAPRALKGRQISAVVNLAYVKNMRDPRLYALTTSLIDGVVDLAAEVGCDRIIHMSTMAVFGYDLARDQATRSVRWYPSDAYIEGKILAENRLIARTEGTGIVPIVLRLGNVIGAGSPAWMAEICQRMLECRPVGYIGRDGFCNATHPRNVGSYVEQLVRCSDATLRAAGTFHHLAELANERWSDVIEAVSASTGLSAICALQSASRRAGRESWRHRKPSGCGSGALARASWTRQPTRAISRSWPS